jgi:general secretion pathway protein D
MRFGDFLAHVAGMAIVLVAGPVHADQVPFDPSDLTIPDLDTTSRIGRPQQEPALPYPDGETNGRTITIDFQDVEIAVLAKFISEVTGHNFIVDERVRGTVTIIAPDEISPADAYAVFQSVLQVKGFTTIPAGRAIKIVPAKEAKESTLLTTADPGRPAAADEFITRLARVRNADVTAVARILEPLVSRDGLVQAYPPANTLLIIDTASNVDRLLTVVQHLDVGREQEATDVIRLTHANATELAATLTTLSAQSEQTAPDGEQGTFPTQTTVVAEERTNALVVHGGPVQLQRARSLIRRLDVPSTGAHSRLHVYPLKFADAETIVEALNELLGVEGHGRAARPSRVAIGSRGGTVRFPSDPPGSSRAPGAAGIVQASATATGGGPEPGGPDVVGDVRLTAEPGTNALLIRAPPQDYAALASIIAQLDVPRPQVYVEAIILEISVDRTRQMGFDFLVSGNIGGAKGLAATNLGNLRQAVGDPTQLSGLILAAASNETVTLPDGSEVPAQVALFAALDDENDVNILSAPNILTSDNEEAEIVIGQNVPFIASRATSQDNLENLFTTVERHDVGITLRITPQITDGDAVRLVIYEEVSALEESRFSEVDALEIGPTTRVRSASTSVIVGDTQTVVIGGLLSDTSQDVERRVPFISSIPVLGHLFRNTRTVHMKTNLLIFLTPHIIRTQRTLQANSRSQRDRMLATVPPGSISRTQARRLREITPAGAGMEEEDLPIEDVPPPVAALGAALTTNWVVQAGSSQDRTRAHTIVERLAAHGYHAFIVPADETGDGWHRVRIRGLESHREATVLSRELVNQGFVSAFVPAQ